MASTYALVLLVTLVMSTYAAPLDEIERLLEDLLVLEDFKDVLSKKQNAVDPQVSTMYEDMKLGKYKWIVFKIDNLNKIVHDFYEPKTVSGDEADREAWNRGAVGVIDLNAPRYILFNTDFTSGDGRKINEIFFMFWNPDDVQRKDKMRYASNNSTFKKSFDGLKMDFQAIDRDDMMDYDAIREEVERKSK